MKRVLWVLSAVVGLVVVTAGLMLAIASTQWNRVSRNLVAELEKSPPAGTVTHADPRVLAALPPPVQRYFLFALPPGQPRITRAVIRHEGTFAQRPGEWAPFTSEERFYDRPRAFVWDASIAMRPLLPVRVRDAYVRGEGRMRGAIGGFLTVVEQHGTPEMASGALLRWLGEAAWMPTALLPGDGLAWEPIDDRTARVRLVDSGVEVALDVHFGADGGIERVVGERFKDEDGRPRLLRWEGRYSDYRRVDGIAIPHAGEVAWVYPDGPQPYWRGTVTGASFEFLKR